MAPRTDFYQTDTQVIVSVFKKGLDPDKVNVQFLTQNLKIDFEGEELDIDLYAPIQEGNSSFKVLKMKLDLTLAKADVGLHWPQLTRSTQPVVTTPAVSTFQPQPQAQDPPQSQAQPERRTFSKWNVPGSLDSLDSDEEEKGTDIDAFFKQLYSGASEETRRAMVKSYLESNGTALSTNWDEVSKGPVPTKPPSGMEPKPYSN